MPVELKGSVEKITFHSPETHFAILKMKTADNEDMVTVCGNFISVSEGEYLHIEGEWVTHPKYGRQVKASSYQKLPLPTIEAVERYLGSGVIKGIGPRRARQIVEKWGEDAIRILENEPERLAEIAGIGKRKIPEIKKSLEGRKELQKTMLALQSFEISPAYALRIYRQYGKSSYEIVKENPYRLAEDIQGIGFLTADKIARKTGIPADSPMRAEAGLIYVLGKMAEEGHVFCPYNELLSRGEKELSIGKESLLKGFATLFERRKVALENMPGPPMAGRDEKAVYLKWLHEAECDTAHGIKKLLEVKHGAQQRFGEIEEEDLLWAEKELRIRLSRKQLDAVRRALKEKVFIITGGPGVGKTTIIKAILRISKEKLKKEKVLLAAPTGRAAKRLAELTGEEAKTIHRLLEYNPREEGFRRNELNPLEGDLVIVDEASMIDIALMSRLLKAVPEGAGLILVGDVNQLASVGPGNVLRDMIDSGAIATERLDEIFRQSGESLITVNAHKINRGEMPYSKSDNSDFYFIEKNEPESVLEKVIELCTKPLPARFGIKDALNDIQVLSPMHKGTLGVANLNRMLQSILNKKGSQTKAGHLKPGDKVMQVRNNYDKDVYNGDTGVVRDIREDGLTVDFEGREIKYEPFETGELQLSYAASVHKAQGSEYPAVIMPLVTEHFMLLQRNLLYTAVTRAKRLMVLVGSKKALAIAVNNSKIEKRHTALRERLISPECLGPPLK